MIFVDSSVWFAAVNRNDRENERAKLLLRKHRELLTSSLVLAETWTLIQRKIHYEVAEAFWSAFRRTNVRVENVLYADLDAAFLRTTLQGPAVFDC